MAGQIEPASAGVPETSVGNRGWTVTFAGTGINLALGILYTWSMFKRAIEKEFGWQGSQLNDPYALCCLVFAAAPTVQARDLSFEQRVAAQKAIEQVYWNHRIWPKENPGPKPLLSTVMPDSATVAGIAPAALTAASDAFATSRFCGYGRP